MKLVFRGLLFHIISIVGFALLYFANKDHFMLDYSVNKRIHFIDCFLTSTSIQAGVGTSIQPLNTVSKSLMSLQQLTMIFITLLMFHQFTS
jgi:hypothetical protein